MPAGALVAQVMPLDASGSYLVVFATDPVDLPDAAVEAEIEAVAAVASSGPTRGVLHDLLTGFGSNLTDGAAWGGILASLIALKTYLVRRRVRADHIDETAVMQRIVLACTQLASAIHAPDSSRGLELHTLDLTRQVDGTWHATVIQGPIAIDTTTDATGTIMTLVLQGRSSASALQPAEASGTYRSRRDLDPAPPNADPTHSTASGATGGHRSRPVAAGAIRPAGGRIQIVMFAANPDATSRLALDREARAITEKLRLADDRSIDFTTCWAVRPDDLLQYLNQYRPQIVHFSGHGAASGEIVLSGETGGAHRVATAALARLFQVMNDDIRVVVLNACYSTAQAQAIGQHIDYVVGMGAPIDDRAATVFAAAFYSALGFRRTIPEAFDQATTALMLHGMPDHATPQLIERPDAHPHLAPHGQRTNHPDTGPHTPVDSTAGERHTPDQQAAGSLSAGSEVLLLAVHAIDRAPLPRPADVEIDIVGLYQGNDPSTRVQLHDPTDWDRVVPTRLRDAARALEAYPTRRVHITGSMRLPMWFATGHALPDVRGWVLSTNQRTQHWQTDTTPTQATATTLATVTIGAGNDLALAIGLTHDPTTEVERYLRQAAHPVGTLLTLGAENGPGQQSVPGPQWAAGWVHAARERARAAVADTGAVRVHLFIAAPAGLAMMLGHAWNLMPPTVIYEHLRPAGYTPTLTLP